jgi:hypothetical protein
MKPFMAANRAYDVDPAPIEEFQVNDNQLRQCGMVFQLMVQVGECRRDSMLDVNSRSKSMLTQRLA